MPAPKYICNVFAARKKTHCQEARKRDAHISNTSVAILGIHLNADSTWQVQVQGVENGFLLQRINSIEKNYSVFIDRVRLPEAYPVVCQ